MREGEKTHSKARCGPRHPPKPFPFSLFFVLCASHMQPGHNISCAAVCQCCSPHRRSCKYAPVCHSIPDVHAIRSHHTTHRGPPNKLCNGPDSCGTVLFGKVLRYTAVACLKSSFSSHLGKVSTSIAFTSIAHITNSDRTLHHSTGDVELRW
jgi:hypothetical protein